LIPTYDLVFIGNASLDLFHPFEEPTQTVIGGAVLMSAMATSWSDKRVALVTRMAERDIHHLDAAREAGIATYISLASETTQHEGFQLTADMDQRRVYMKKSAGAITAADLPAMDARLLHFAGITNQEFGLDLLESLGERGCAFSVDMQSFVRQLDGSTGEVLAADFPQKAEVAAMADKIKLDVMEAEVLTGKADLEQAAIQFESWGAREVMITCSDGILVRHEGRTYFEALTPRWVRGRTGRGDTTFGAYLARRLDFDVPQSLKFAAAAVSIKLERQGPLKTTKDEIARRMAGACQA
jgi:sugar/nucleoside kinase (ribokinase family)